MAVVDRGGELRPPTVVVAAKVSLPSRSFTLRTASTHQRDTGVHIRRHCPGQVPRNARSASFDFRLRFRHRRFCSGQFEPRFFSSFTGRLQRKPEGSHGLGDQPNAIGGAPRGWFGCRTALSNGTQPKPRDHLGARCCCALDFAAECYPLAIASRFCTSARGRVSTARKSVSSRLFLLAAIGYHLRLKESRTPFDRSLYISAVLNIASCLAASQSDRTFDTPFAFAEILQSGS